MLLAVVVILWGWGLQGRARGDAPITPTAVPVVADGVTAVGSEASTNVVSTEADDSGGRDEMGATKGSGGQDRVRERLLDGEQPNVGGGEQLVFESRLEVARRQRRVGRMESAVRDLVGLLRSGAPNDVKRPALLELASIAEESGQAGRAQQILAQYSRLFSLHPSVVEVYLRQGLLFREMGATDLALAKFHAVFSSALSQRFDQLDYYRRMVLQAQTEIAETYYLIGRWEEAREYFQRVLRLDAPRVTKMQIHYKLVRVLSELAKDDQAVAQAKVFIETYPEAGQLPEVRFLLAKALKKQGQNPEALAQVMQLLESGRRSASERPEEWAYWQKRAGNDIANQLYREGDYVSTLEIYRKLADLDPSAAWQLPVWYQLGLVYERLEQPAKAVETYDRITVREDELKKDAGPPSLMLVVEMAKWRRGNLAWLRSAEVNSATLRPLVTSASTERANE